MQNKNENVELSQGILNTIRQSYSQMSKSNKKLADYILLHYDEVVFLTAVELGNKVGVSESTVVRFPSAIGLKGYPEFIKALSDIVSEKFRNYDRIDIKSSNMKADDVVSAVMTMDSKKIEATLSKIDSSIFNLAVDTILEAKSVYIVGVRSCEPLATFLGYYLRLIRDNVNVITSCNSSEIFEKMFHIGSEDVMIGISFPRYSIRTLKALEFANNRKARIISITDGIHSPMNMYSSCNLFANSDMASIVDSLVAPMSLINALIVTMCIRRGSYISERLTEMEGMMEDYTVAGNDDINYLDENVINELKEL